MGYFRGNYKDLNRLSITCAHLTHLQVLTFGRKGLPLPVPLAQIWARGKQLQA